ncbi:nuclear transport factor 2 family protein [Nocardia sp. KC 131]|uniref:nuclear transport factor 2 family protein n=1 Tax=Nocardia arseniciresistens TaxID=3392119 RepID=UPI00398EE207
MPRTIQQLLDTAEIIDTTTAYATAVDTRDWDLLGTLFADDAVWEYLAGGERHTGRTAILARIRPSIERLDATQHINTNHQVTFDGDAAFHSCYYLAQHIRRGAPGGDTFLAAGSYEDRLSRTDTGWQLTSRVLRSTWSDGNIAVFQP